MKKIGFIDYYISEWHANNYPEWIKNASARLHEELQEEFTVAYAWGEIDKSPVTGETTDEWCQRMGVERCASIEELCQKSDYVLILAPSDPQTHLGYAKQALPCGKHTYIDKTFAPDLKTEQEIFDIAAKYNTKFFTSSALRFSQELDGKENGLAIMTTGGGGNPEEYIIHQVEMLVRTMGIGATGVTAKKSFDKIIFDVTYADNRIGQMIYAQNAGFGALITNKDGVTGGFQKMTSDFFGKLIEEILRFYATGKYCFDPAQTLEVMKIRQWAVEALATL